MLCQNKNDIDILYNFLGLPYLFHIIKNTGQVQYLCLFTLPQKNIVKTL